MNTDLIRSINQQQHKSLCCLGSFTVRPEPQFNLKATPNDINGTLNGKKHLFVVHHAVQFRVHMMGDVAVYKC